MVRCRNTKDCCSDELDDGLIEQVELRVKETCAEQILERLPKSKVKYDRKHDLIAQWGWNACYQECERITRQWAEEK